ncbi:MAG TPA: methyltransferase [Kiritimatiellia bacterium]|nr:methyltransferase [Kiritimatiellia bacterium]
MKRIPSWVLVGGQLSLFGYLLVSGSWMGWHGGWLLISGGAALGVWALATMKFRYLRVMPEVHPEGRLLIHGPYRWVRHPMYSSLLLCSAGVVGGDPQGPRLAALAGLVVVLVVKLTREERMLREAFPDYAAYEEKTKRLVPGMW